MSNKGGNDKNVTYSTIFFIYKYPGRGWAYICILPHNPLILDIRPAKNKRGNLKEWGKINQNVTHLLNSWHFYIRD